MEIYTIGFTKKRAAEFFGALKHASIARLMDVRLNNSSQLAGFTKREDLAYFLREICGAEYVHEPRLAPTAEILDGFKDDLLTWAEYEQTFRALLEERQVAEALDPRDFAARTVLLCSEPDPEHCHRRLVAEYLREKWGDVRVIHL